MAKLNLTHTIRCDVDTFWKTFFDAEYNDKLYLGALAFPAFPLTRTFPSSISFRAAARLNPETCPAR